jgi:probable rRNA maturation factor
LIVEIVTALKVSIDRPSPSDRIRVSLANEQTAHAIDERQLMEAAAAIVRDSWYTSANISLAVVDDATMHELNRRHLQHDYPTDVLSFLLNEEGDHLEGEVIISSETAAAEAKEHGWSPAAEQLLYVIHGMLHLVGYRDQSPGEIAEIRAVEEKYLRRFGYSQAAESGDGNPAADMQLGGSHHRGESAR